MRNNIIGIDLAKNIFRIHKATASGKKIVNRSMSRLELIEFMSKEQKSLVGMEACAGAYYFGRKFREMGHEVKLMSPKFVKAYVKSNKNDAADAEAIAEAVQRENMRFVAIKSEEQQAIVQIHKSRAMLVGNRTALVNEIRGFLLEFGIAIAVGRVRFVENAICELEERENLPVLLKENINNLLNQVKKLDEQIKYYDKKINELFKVAADAKRIATIPGVGVITATAILAFITDFQCFNSGRDLSAFLGLVPRQFSSGGKTNLGKISKRGNSYLRKLLVQGAVAVLKHEQKGDSKRSLWIKKLVDKVGKKKAAVALANKNTRIIYALMKEKNQAFEYSAAA